MTQPAKKTPAKRAPRKAAAKAPAAPAGGPPPGVLVLGQNPDAVEMEDFFHLDGVTYQIAKAPKPGQGLRFLREAQDPRIGFASAQANLLRAMVGEGAIAALEASQSVSKADVTALFDALTDKLFGAASPDPS